MSKWCARLEDSVADEAHGLQAKRCWQRVADFSLTRRGSSDRVRTPCAIMAAQATAACTGSTEVAIFNIVAHEKSSGPQLFEVA